MPKITSRSELKPLEITCTSTDCENDLHCFKQSKKQTPQDRGKCRSCGVELVDWQRVHQRNFDDIDFTFQSLKYELVRHHFWHVDVDQKAINHARRKGLLKLQDAAYKTLNRAVKPAMPIRDGRQTPKQGNIIYYAQHALACCCRTCIAYWHGIPMGSELSHEQLDYFQKLVMTYIKDRIPNITEGGEKIPPILRTEENHGEIH